MHYDELEGVNMDQPKPATGCTHPPEDRCSMCKPASGEWTVETIAILQAHGGIDAIVVTHNAALATAEEKRQQDARLYERTIDAFKNQLAAEFKRGYESTVGWKIAEERLDEIRQLEAQLAVERESRIKLTELAVKFERQLADEKRKREALEFQNEASIIKGLKEQLAVERERTKALVDAMEESGYFTQSWLAQVKDENRIRAEDNPGYNRHE